jgi:hypothetical protein
MMIDKENEMMNKKQVAVYKNGKIVGHVSQSTTSIGASKVAGSPCEMARINGWLCWRTK